MTIDIPEELLASSDDVEEYRDAIDTILNISEKFRTLEENSIAKNGVFTTDKSDSKSHVWGKFAQILADAAQCLTKVADDAVGSFLSPPTTDLNRSGRIATYLVVPNEEGSTSETQTHTISCGSDEPSYEFDEARREFVAEPPKFGPPSVYFSERKNLALISENIPTDYELKMNRVVGTMVATSKIATANDLPSTFKGFSERTCVLHANDIMTKRLILVREWFNETSKYDEFVRTLSRRVYYYQTQEGNFLPSRSSVMKDLIAKTATMSEQYIIYYPLGFLLGQHGFPNNVPRISVATIGDISREKIIEIRSLYLPSNVMAVHVATTLDRNGDRDYKSKAYRSENLLILIKSHKESRMNVYYDQYGMFWSVKDRLLENELKRVENDFKYIKMFGLLDKFVTPLIGRSICEHGRNVLLYRLGVSHELKTLDKKSIDRVCKVPSRKLIDAMREARDMKSLAEVTRRESNARALRSFCCSMSIFISTMGYMNGLIRLNSEGRIVVPHMNGKCRKMKKGMYQIIFKEYTNNRCYEGVHFKAVVDIISFVQFRTNAKGYQDLIGDLRLEAGEFNMADSVNRLSDELLVAIPSKPTKTLVYNEDGYLMAELKDGVRSENADGRRVITLSNRH